MIRRIAVIGLIAATGLLLGAPANAEPKPPLPGGILSGIVVHAPINIPVIACVTAMLGLSDSKDDPDDFCLHLPDQTK